MAVLFYRISIDLLPCRTAEQLVVADNVHRPGCSGTLPAHRHPIRSRDAALAALKGSRG